ncbi:MAG: hypothetical protein FWG33_00725 [Oscillospiraceae bacterium]|nr:hypothetical protein [Oscillospiraceae bacterium]
MNNRIFPEISFVDTNTERLVTALIRGYERIADRTLFPGDPVRLFILWIADIIIQERVIINESAKQNVPRYGAKIVVFIECDEEAREIKIILPEHIPPTLSKEQWIKISTAHLMDCFRTML